MKLLYGTGNPAKLSAMKSRLEKLDIELIGLNDLKAKGITNYAGLVKRYGNLMAGYKNAICFVMDEKHIYEAMEPSMESGKFILTDIPHSTVRKKGFPLDSMSVDIETNQYFYDLPADKLEKVAVEDGFLDFFQKVLRLDNR